jgi:hypothetical protein
MRATRLAGVVVTVALAIGASGIPPAAASARGSSLPPSSRRELAAIFDKKANPFGLRVTRAAPVNLEQERDPKGTHLAIHVEPTGDDTPLDDIDGTVDGSRVFLPSVFKRWKGLKWFGSELVDWNTADVATMIRTSQEEAAATPTNGNVRFSVYVAKHLENTPAYEAFVGTSTTTPASPTVRDHG